MIACVSVRVSIAYPSRTFCSRNASRPSWRVPKGSISPMARVSLDGVDVVEEDGIAVLRGRAVRQEDDVLVRLVAGLHRRAGMPRDDAAGQHVDTLPRIADQHGQGPA